MAAIELDFPQSQVFLLPRTPSEDRPIAAVLPPRSIGETQAKGARDYGQMLRTILFALPGATASVFAIKAGLSLDAYIAEGTMVAMTLLPIADGWVRRRNSASDNTAYAQRMKQATFGWRREPWRPTDKLQMRDSDARLAALRHELVDPTYTRAIGNVELWNAITKRREQERSAPTPSHSQTKSGNLFSRMFSHMPFHRKQGQSPDHLPVKQTSQPDMSQLLSAQRTRIKQLRELLREQRRPFIQFPGQA